MRIISRYVILALLGLLGFGCSTGSELRKEANEIEQQVDSVRSAALTCAPKELAKTESQVEFGQQELDWGNFTQARDHLDRADKHLKSVQKKSDYDACTTDTKPINIDAQTDRDDDGIGDEQDNCPNIPEDVDNYKDDDGCPDVDNDFDGVPDERDECLGKPEDFDGFEDKDGCPDTDNDGDGIADVLDECPEEAEDYDGDLDDDGCPEERELVTVEKERIRLDKKVHFETDKATILPQSYPLLNEVAKVLEANPEIVIRIEGHTDSRGSDSYNMKLSNKRAASVRKYLLDRGISTDRIESKGYGESQPIADNATAEGRAQNRRVEIHITERK
jgi:outer membrane protein OmpA-like peptidoglycan-associated protein